MRDTNQGLLERMARKVPDFAGYLDREERRDDDRKQREALAKASTSLKRHVQDLQEELLNAGDMKAMARLGDVTNRLDRVTERLRHANEGYRGFFDKDQIDTEELNRVYEFDLALHDDLEKAVAACSDRSVSDLEQGVRDLDAKLDERERMLRGVG